MAIISTVRCSNLRKSVAFYTDLLGFAVLDGEEDLGDPGFCALSRCGDRLFLSSHGGDGEYGQAIVIVTDNVDQEWQALRQRGLVPPVGRDSPVHQGPLDQTWGTREFYVDDPDGNTLRFVQHT